MEETMTVTRLPMLTFAVSLALAACASPVEQRSSDTEAPPTTATRSNGPALAIEEAERSLDVGRDVTGARASLEAVLEDPTIMPEQRDEARLALSRALEAAGDREAAVVAVESLLAAHPAGSRYPLEDAAQVRLRVLLTGHDARPGSVEEDARQASAFARALVKYYPTANAAGALLAVRILAYGGSSEASDRLGTFAIARAIRAVRREACPLCDDHLSIHTDSGRSSWVGIPRDRAQLASSLAIFYFDLDDGRIPARYDGELPLASADIAARLARGDGLVAIRERPGAPPAVLIAAPREAQLADVEEALAAMKTIPVEPVAVPLKASLKPTEIQAVVRAAFGEYRRCYGALLKSDPAAAGTSRLKFAIRGDGSVDALTVDSDTGLRGLTFDGCMTDVTRALVFPQTHAHGATTVTYPIMFAPGP
jgi:hypothetical protein